MTSPYDHFPDHGYHRRNRHDPAAISAAREALNKRANTVRERVDIKDVVERVVSLKKAGRALIGCCPFHADSTASLAVYPRGGDRVKVPFFVCYGCDLKGDVIKFVMERQKLEFREAIELLESENGLKHLQASTPAPAAPKLPQAGDDKKLKRAQQLWAESIDLAPGGVVDLYLRGRALVPPADYGVGDAATNGGWPVDLKFHGRCWHDLERKEFPAMVAAIRGYDGALLTVHRTYLVRQTGGWGKAAMEKAKLVVGTFGPGFIRLGPDADEMTGGEGIESSLSAMQLYKRSGLAFVNSGRLKSVEPPFMCSNFIYAADKGAKLGKKPWGEIFAREGARTFGGGRTVAVKIPNIAAAKGDFNDLLQQRARGEWRPPAPAAIPPSPPKVKAPPPREPDASAVVQRLDDVGKAERAARERFVRAQEAAALVDRTDDAALAAARAERRAAYQAWQRTVGGRRVPA